MSQGSLEANFKISTRVVTIAERGIREFKIYDATVAKTLLKIASSSLSMFFIIRAFKS